MRFFTPVEISHLVSCRRTAWAFFVIFRLLRRLATFTYDPKTKSKNRNPQAAKRRFAGLRQASWEKWEDIEREDQLPKGDTLALFLWREMAEAEGNAREAARMLQTIKGEITSVWNALLVEQCRTEFPDNR